jgi:serine O-acetyltransferase
MLGIISARVSGPIRELAEGGAGVDRTDTNVLGLLEVIREDLRTNFRELGRPGFQALLAYRLGSWALRRHGMRARFLRWIEPRLRAMVRWRVGIELHPQASLGRRISVGHQGGIYVGGDATMGDDCEILQGVHVGRFDAEPAGGPGPIIGHRVRLGARSHLVGAIHIGDDARIGPNSIVISDVPSGATLIARPSKVRRLPRADGTETISGSDG